jgi:hypothetical protein
VLLDSSLVLLDSSLVLLDSLLVLLDSLLVLLLLKAEQSSASEPTPWYSQPSLQHSSIVR